MRVAQYNEHGTVTVVSQLFDPPLILPAGMSMLPDSVPVGSELQHVYNELMGAFVFVGAPPTYHHRWNFVTSAWDDSRSLADLKSEAWESIKSRRESAIDAPLTTPYGAFDCGPKDRTNITDAVLLLQTLTAVGTPTNIDFTLSDNSTVSLTTTEMVTVGLLLGQKVQAAHTQARTLRAQIDAATSSTELEAIVWV